MTMEEQPMKWATIVAMTSELLYPPNPTAEERARAAAFVVNLREQRMVRHAELLNSPSEAVRVIAALHANHCQRDECDGCDGAGDYLAEWPCRTWLAIDMASRADGH